LPIITQLWELSTRKNNSPPSNSSINKTTPLVIAIEQPELHLHPAIQAKLAKAFIACIDLARKNNRELQLIIETHSETIVNYFGRAISRKQLKPNDVSVIIFEKKAGNNTTTVQNSSYDEDGFLTNWPYGFFDSEE
jgi:predicted ATPase